MINLFVSWDGDKIGRMVGRARLTDDVEKVRRIDQAIGRGNEILRSWTQAVGGSVIEIAGDEGSVQVPATAISDLEALRHNYRTIVGATLSCGIGQKLSESSKALLAAKLRGGDKTVIFDQKVAQEVAEASQKPQDEAGKLREEYLEPQEDGNLVRQGPDDQTPTNLGYLAKPEGLNKAISQIQPGTELPKEWSGAVAKSFDYSHVLPQHAKDAGLSIQVHHDKPKDGSVMPGRGPRGNLRAVVYGPATGNPSIPKEQLGSVKGYVFAGKGDTNAIEPHSELRSEYHGKGLGTAMYEALYAHAKHVGINQVEGGDHSEKAHQLHQRLAAKHGFEYNGTPKYPYDPERNAQQTFPYSSYQYTLKNDLDAAPIDDHEIIGPGKGITFIQGSGGQIEQPLPAQNTPMEQSVPPVAQVHPLEGRFREMADGQMRADSSVQQRNDSRIAQLKAQIATMLGSFQQQMPIFGQLKSSFPDTYQTIMGMVQSVIALGREVQMGKPQSLPTDEGMMKDEPRPHHPEGLPPGTLHGGEIKVKHADGGVSWKQVHEGLSQAQDRNAPLLGANSHPTSPKSPDSN